MTQTFGIVHVLVPKLGNDSAEVVRHERNPP
jgi:hypothetical protein